MPGYQAELTVIQPGLTFCHRSLFFHSQSIIKSLNYYVIHYWYKYNHSLRLQHHFNRHAYEPYHIKKKLPAHLSNILHLVLISQVPYIYAAIIIICELITEIVVNRFFYTNIAQHPANV